MISLGFRILGNLGWLKQRNLESEFMPMFTGVSVHSNISDRIRLNRLSLAREAVGVGQVPRPSCSALAERAERYRLRQHLDPSRPSGPSGS